MDFIEARKFRWGKWLARIIIFSGAAFLVCQIILPTGLFGMTQSDLALGCIAVGFGLTFLVGKL
ncbi:MAG TPA: hypothetical protein VNH18_23340 [Bryobacteraceae bacterium]|nr:hypothetical protein [Bryobacteraceae bacterium]